MMRATALMLLLALQAGCSTRPRDFRPNMVVAPVNQDVQMRDFAVCKMMVDRGVRGNFSKQAVALAPGAVGATAGFAVGFAAVVSTAASGTVSAITSAITGTTATTTTTAGAATLSTALPIIGAAASVAIAAGIKKSNEKKVKSALGTCMKEYGHDVTTWQLDRSKTSALPAELPRDPAKADENKH
jgi:hypothetical protein